MRERSPNRDHRRRAIGNDPDSGPAVGRMRVRGRGGTVLQPAIDLLRRAADFPPDAPILVITDGECDVLRITCDHAFLMPAGARLPFTPRGPVFTVR